MDYDLEFRILQVSQGLEQEEQERVGGMQSGTCGTSIKTTDCLFLKIFFI